MSDRRRCGAASTLTDPLRTVADPLFMSLPSMWFLKRRGFATGIAVSGTGFGGAVGSLIIRSLLPKLVSQNRRSQPLKAHTLRAGLAQHSLGLRRYQRGHIMYRLLSH